MLLPLPLFPSLHFLVLRRRATTGNGQLGCLFHPREKGRAARFHWRVARSARVRERRSRSLTLDLCGLGPLRKAKASQVHRKTDTQTPHRVSTDWALYGPQSNQGLLSVIRGASAKQEPWGQSAEQAGCGLQGVLQQQKAARAKCTCAGAAHRHASLILKPPR